MITTSNTALAGATWSILDQLLLALMNKNIFTKSEIADIIKSAHESQLEVCEDAPDEDEKGALLILDGILKKYM